MSSIRLMADHDVQGHVTRLMDICQLEPWLGLWHDLQCRLLTFEDLKLARDATDATLWKTCRENEVLLITVNRNPEGPESLEVTIPQRTTNASLPLLTLADPDRIGRDTQYAKSVVERLFDVLIDVEALRGTGRLYLP